MKRTHLPCLLHLGSRIYSHQGKRRRLAALLLVGLAGVTVMRAQAAEPYDYFAANRQVLKAIPANDDAAG